MRDSTTNNGYAYLGSARYTVSNGVATFESVPFAMGRIRKNADGYAVHAYITDHVGNTRAIVDGINQTVIAKFDYTPFGACTADTTATATTDYRLTGKELQNITDAELYDFGARYYLPEYATWTSQDPLAEEDYNIGSYNYCASDPINRIDPTGRIWINKNRQIIYQDGHYTKAATQQDKAIGNELRKTPTGNTQCIKLTEGKLPITISLSQKENNNEYGVIQSLKDAKKQKIIGKEIILYERSTSKFAKDIGVRAEQSMSATLGHEIEHTTPENLKLQLESMSKGLNSSNTPASKLPEEKNPTIIKRKILDEYKKLNQQ